MKKSSRNHSHFSPKVILPASLVLMVLMAVAAVAAPPPPKSKPLAPELQAVIDRFDGAQARIQRISAIFEEVKTLALLKDPLVQSGRFFHTKPDKFLWEYTKPEPKTRISLPMSPRVRVPYLP